MAVLAFKVEADYEEVLRLRQEIDKLKSELKGINSSLNPGNSPRSTTSCGRRRHVSAR